ncbi:hypothetical protein [Litoreibacter roseus]|uniref:DUF3072 family protein n=1 Tax=Litoreibacter roseus TaxID=2601869 RepID=A0A6N6JGU0_9RHOB|nr:hypothetical protein [Litoreibacter roseus]GFE65436.1 hypothetical protein KIN_25100 [Litoreibacter roseus]
MIPPTKAVIGGDDSVVPSTPEDGDGPARPETEAELRQLADALGEPYDGDLTERQAQDRISALKEQKNS